MPHFDHYSAREQAVFLRIDNPQGIQALVEWLRVIGNTYRPQDANPFQQPDDGLLRGFFHDAIARYERFRNSSVSSKN